LPIVKYVGSQWTANISILSGSVKVYEIVADDAEGTNVRRVSEGISGEAYVFEPTLTVAD
jgi:hypothetical protein